MKIGAILLSGVVVVGALACVVWVGRYRDVHISAGERTSANPDRDAATSKVAEEFSEVEPPPPVSKTPPYPKAVAEVTKFHFDVMGVGEELQHAFIIRNVGEANLLLSRGATNCKCTISALGRREVPPGEQVEIELAWRPTDTSSSFAKVATIQTNDPENLKIRFTVEGRVTEQVELTPPHRWVMGDVLEDVPAEITGTICSPLTEEFEIVSIEGSHPLLTAEATPLTEAELQSRMAKAGYLVKAMLSPGVPVGPFKEKLNIRTTVGPQAEEKLYVVEVTAFRAGPIRFLSAIKGMWYPRRMALLMGPFEAAAGRVTTLPLFVSDLDEEFKLLQVDSELDFLNVTLEPDPRLNSRTNQAFLLKFEIPAGSPRVARERGNGAEVVLHTNHPAVPQLRMFVEFVTL